jgi:hypothetical protein
MNNILPKNNREVLEHLLANGAKRNFVERVAYEMSEDFDDKNKQIEPEGYPDKFISEEEQQIKDEFNRDK